jgi:adenylate kinase
MGHNLPRELWPQLVDAITALADRAEAGGGVRVLMIAPPGRGKGTQGVVIAEHFGIPHIATGDLLRDHVARGTELGQSVQGFLDRGELVPDEVVLDMVRTALEELQGDGFVLDGVPRTMEQAGRCTRSPSSSA